MNSTYYFKKQTYNKNKISFMQIFFDNGDHISIKGFEVVDLSIKTYDNLIKHTNGYSPVVAEGFIKLDIQKKITFAYNNNIVYNPSDFKNDRKSYIENRCLNESTIKKIYLFDNNNWHKVLLGNIRAIKKDQYLILEFLPTPQMGAFDGDKHSISLGNINKNNIHNIDIDFENCESFVIYQDEIKEINLSFNSNLEWGAGNLFREINGGYMVINLDKDIKLRENNLFEEKIFKTSDFEKRLCGPKGFDTHDICHLYITYNYPGFGEYEKECIGVNPINEGEEEDKNGYTYYFFESGYCKKLNDKSIIICFGEKAKNTIEKFN